MGERAILVSTPGKTLAAYAALRDCAPPEVEDLVPGDGALLVVFWRGAVPADMASWIRAHGEPRQTTLRPREHAIPVVFGGLDDDLVQCARRAGLGETAFVESLCAAVLEVAFLGFQPGFPYLTGLSGQHMQPRRATPRVAVPAGSVGLGGSYAGIYPATGPGGWQIIGQTSVCLFDPGAQTPARLAPGDRVRFVAV